MPVQAGKGAAALQVLGEEENLRAYYPARVGLPAWHMWKGLSLGASAEGVAFAGGRPVMQPADGGGAAPGVEAYARSLRRFAGRLRTGRAKEAALARAAAVLAAPAAPLFLPPLQPAPAPQMARPGALGPVAGVPAGVAFFLRCC